MCRKSGRRRRPVHRGCRLHAARCMVRASRCMLQQCGAAASDADALHERWAAPLCGKALADVPHATHQMELYNMQRAVLLHCNIPHTARHAPHAARHSSTAARSTPSSAPHGGDAAARALACCSETCACDACSVRHEAMKSRSDKVTPCGSLEAPAGAAAQRPVPRASSPFRSAAQQAPHECFVMRRLRASVSAHCCTDLDG